MSFKIMAITPVLAMCAAAGAIALGAPASAEPSSAEPGSCNSSGAATVCESPGSASIVAQPNTATEGGAADQNGMYGPAGDVPPVGRGN